MENNKKEKNKTDKKGKGSDEDVELAEKDTIDNAAEVDEANEAPEAREGRGLIPKGTFEDFFVRRARDWMTDEAAETNEDHFLAWERAERKATKISGNARDKSVVGWTIATAGTTTTVTTTLVTITTATATAARPLSARPTSTTPRGSPRPQRLAVAGSRGNGAPDAGIFQR